MTHLVVVEADLLDVDERNLPVILRFARGPVVERAIEWVVEEELREHYGILWWMRRHRLEEVLRMKGKTLDLDATDIRGAAEELGIERVVEAVGVERVVEAVGIERVVEAVGVERVVEAVGVERVVEAIGASVVIEALVRRHGAEAVRREIERCDGEGERGE